MNQLNQGGSFILTEDGEAVKVEGTVNPNRGKQIYGENFGEPATDTTAASHEAPAAETPAAASDGSELQPSAEQVRHDQIVEAIGKLNVDNADLWQTNGKPKVSALSDLLGFTVTTAERDAAWAQINP